MKRVGPSFVARPLSWGTAWERDKVVSDGTRQGGIRWNKTRWYQMEQDKVVSDGSTPKHTYLGEDCLTLPLTRPELISPQKHSAGIPQQA